MISRRPWRKRRTAGDGDRWTSSTKSFWVNADANPLVTESWTASRPEWSFHRRTRNAPQGGLPVKDDAVPGGKQDMPWLQYPPQ